MRYLLYLASLLLLAGCEKEITVNLPDVAPKLVVDGRIEMNENPLIILTKTSNYFDPTDLNSVANSFVNDATITIDDGTTTNNMIQICSSSLTPAQQEALAEQLGIDKTILQNYNICGYTHSMVGQEGFTYTINIDWQGKNYTSSTVIPPVIPLDSTWFEVEGNLDSLGFLNAILSDPPTQGNAYRWFAKRINNYTYGNNIGEQKDPTFLAPLGSAARDDFFNGKTFDFGYTRKSNTEKADDKNNERGYYKVGDTVVIKFCTIDNGVYTYLHQAESQRQSNGSPFSSPLNVPSNINNGALGVWAGYGTWFDTVVATR